MTQPLADRLAAAGVDPHADPLSAWRELHAAEGSRATVIDLYELVAAPRGLAPHELPLRERHALARTVLTVGWPGWTELPGSGRVGDVIEVVEHDPAWALRFAEWAARLRDALGTTAERIDHIGSTSVPGLAAKPIVDIQISVAELFDEAAYVPALARAGVQLRSRDDWHRYFRPFSGRPRDVHVHVCPTGSVWEREHLLLRDHLRTHRDDCDEYARAKRRAAQLWADDGLAFNAAKSAVVLEILDRARRQ